MPKKIIDKETGVSIVTATHESTKVDIWLIHAYTESSESFNGIFKTDFYKKFNIFIPDLPDFGESKFDEKYLNLKNVIELLKCLINKYSSGRPLIIIGHSLGATIATILIPSLNEVELFINVEGMLVEDLEDARSLTKAGKFVEPTKFVEYMCSRLSKVAESNFFIRRYLDNILSANPLILHAWAMSSTDMLSGNKVDRIYRSLNCKKVYVQGGKTMSNLELAHVDEQNYDRIVIPDAGHWPMLENPDIFWNAIKNLISRINADEFCEGKNFLN